MTSNDAVQEKLRARARDLLEKDVIASFVGWEPMRYEGRTTPLVCLSCEDTDRLVFDEHCAANTAKYARDLKGQGRVGIACRGCDARAVNRMIEDNQLAREDVYLLGIPCPGMRDRTTVELLSKCAACAHRNPVIYDELLGDPVEDTAPRDRYARVHLIEEMDRVARQKYFNDAFERCIRCYACRDACPCCTCRICFVDQRNVGWVGKQGNLNENRFYGIIRAFHIADRCIECGECERVCPMGLPLIDINQKLVQDMNVLFGEYESGMTSENPDALRSFVRSEYANEFE